MQVAETLPDIAEQRRKLPDHPGVYLFKDAEGKVLYVHRRRSRGLALGRRDRDVLFWIVGALAAVGAFTRSARAASGFLWTPPIVLLLSTIFIDSASRYRMPLEPFIIILAALGLPAGLDWLRRRTRMPSTNPPMRE